MDEFNCSVLTDHEIDIFTYTVNNVIGKDVTLQDGGEIKEGEYYLTINDLSPEKIKVSFASEGLDFVFLIKSVCLLILILILIDMTITGITIKNRKKAHVNYKLFDTEKDNYIYEENEEKIQLIEKMMSDRTV